jgi:signal transduction histidine kinase
VATVIVAVAFERVRNTSQHVANRLIHGERATPYEVLSRFSRQTAGTYAGGEVLPRMARILADGTGASSAQVWLRAGGALRPAAWWPELPGGLEEIPLVEGRPLQIPGVDSLVAVRHHGELLGALAVAKPSGEPLTPIESGLLSDLAAQAGLVFRNARLTAELEARLVEISTRATELRASRARIVAAQDLERRRLERNIHDGAQQHLVALAVKLQLTQTFAMRAPDRARQLLDELRAATAAAQETLITLTQGIHPAVLTEQGLVAALLAHADAAPAPVEITVKEVARYDMDVEAAVYFCCLEALQNVAKHAGPVTTLVVLEGRPDELRFSIIDDGAGFDLGGIAQGLGLQSMADRMEALGGRLRVRSVRGRGTTVTGSVPVRRMEPAS